MGIPQFYRWLIENFPKVLENNLNGEIKFNNLYIDMNGVVHNAIKLGDGSNKTVSTTSSPTTTTPTTNGSSPTSLASLLLMKEDMPDEKIKENMFLRLNQMIENVNPTSLIYIGVDGVPPRAKAIEQRKRRFKSSKENVDVIIKQLKAQNKPILRETIMEQLELVFDSNSISPATEFIEKVDQWIFEYCQQLSEKRPYLSIIISNSTVPGEGEHKIMDYIRANHSNLQQDGMSHCFYGMDADLIFLGLESHLSNFYIIRDPISLISCSICKSTDDHSNYECQSAYALKKQLQKKSTTVVVRNLPLQCSKLDIQNIFQYYGKINIIKVEKSNTKKQTLNAYVEFENEKVVNEITTRGTSFTVNNERISLNVEYLDDVFKPKNEKGEIIEDDDNDDENVNAAEDGSSSKEDKVKEQQQQQAKEEDNHIPENSVFVIGLDSLVSKFDIVTFFEKFGTVKSFELKQSPRFIKQQFAMIKFETQEAAQLACQATDVEFFGTKISIKKAQFPTAKPDSNAAKPKVLPTEEEKLAKEKLKEKKKLIKESKIEKLTTLVDPNTERETVVFYLGLSNWNVEKAFENYLLFNKASLYHNSNNVEQQNGKKKILFDFVNISTFRTYLEYYLFEKVEKSKREQIDFNRCINDITVMCFLLGNDFLPHLPSISISNGSIELILCWYRDWIQNSLINDKIKYIVDKDATHINFEYFVPLLESFSMWESTMFPENLEKQVRKEFIKSNKQHGGQSTNTTNEIVPEFVYDDLLYYKVKLNLMDKSDQEVKKVVDDMCFQFTLGLHWVLRYYTHGCQAWEWYYPYHYSPLAKDLHAYQKRLSNMMSASNSNADLVRNQFNFKLGKPLSPLVHLTSVLPNNSIGFVPLPLQSVAREPSPFLGSYRDDYKIDLNGENVAWKAIVLLDFMDHQKLKEYLEPIIESQLTDQEKKRNQVGNDFKIKNGKTVDYLVAGKSINHCSNNTNSYSEDEAIPQINKTMNLNDSDLSYPTRSYFTTSPFASSDYTSFIQIPTSQPPTTDPNTPAPLSKEQIQFLEWRKSVTGFNKSLEILDAIDFSKSSCYNIDKKQPQISTTSLLGRVLNNEFSTDNSDISIKSLDDSQLIINIGFKTPVKLSSIKFISSTAQDKESVPKVIKIYTNSVNPNIDFSVVNTLVPKCTIQYDSPNELDSLSSPVYSFCTTNFKSVNNLSIFIESNHSTNQNKVTIIDKIILS